MDRVTGLGQTFSSWLAEGNAMTLSEVNEMLSEAAQKDIVESRTLSEVVVNNGELHLSEYPDNPLCRLDDDGYCAFGAILGIPTAYMKRLDRYMREQNIGYWTDELGEKRVRFTARDGYLAEVSDNDAITVSEVIQVLCETLQFSSYVVYSIERGTNSTMLTIFDPIMGFGVGEYGMHRGLRVVVPETLKAIQVDPCLLEAESCGVVEIVNPDGPVQVRNCTRDEIIQSVSEFATKSSHILSELDHPHFWVDEVSNPVRRVDLYCREHSLPDRVAALAHEKINDFDKAASRVSYSDVVSLFANLGFESVVKPMSRVKCEKLAGHILVEGASEHRCPRCDNLEL